MSRRLATRAKKYALVQFCEDRRYAILESKKIKTEFPFQGQKNVDVHLLSEKNKITVFKADIIDVNDSKETLEDILEHIPTAVNSKNQSFPENTENRTQKENAITTSMTRLEKNVTPEHSAIVLPENDISVHDTSHDDTQNESERSFLENIDLTINKCKCVTKEEIRDLIKEGIEKYVDKKLNTVLEMCNNINELLTKRKIRHDSSIKLVVEDPALLTKSPIKNPIERKTNLKDQILNTNNEESIEEQNQIGLHHIANSTVNEPSFSDDSTTRPTSYLEEIINTDFPSNLKDFESLFTTSPTINSAPSTMISLPSTNFPMSNLPMPNMNLQNMGQNIAVGKSPSKSLMASYVITSQQSGGVNKLVASLLDFYFDKETLTHNRVNSTNRTYGGKPKIFGKLDPYVIAKIKSRVSRTYPNEVGQMTDGQFNEIVNNKCRRYFNRMKLK